MTGRPFAFLESRGEREVLVLPGAVDVKAITEAETGMPSVSREENDT